MNLPLNIRRGVSALAEGRPADAVEALLPVAEDPGLQCAEDLADVRARVCSLLSQAYLEGHDAARAERWAREALRIATDLGDERGREEILRIHRAAVAEVLQLHRNRQAQAAARALLDTPLETLEASETPPEEKLEALVERAHAEISHGTAEHALRAARLAVDLARACGSVRYEVLARIVIATADPLQAREQLLSAWRAADRAREFTLIGVVVRAAELSDISLPTLNGPLLGPLDDFAPIPDDS